MKPVSLGQLGYFGLFCQLDWLGDWANSVNLDNLVGWVNWDILGDFG